jgi:hypothetical protein
MGLPARDYFAAFALRVRALPFFRAAEPYRFLKHARQRASRRFLNDGARSSLPQYLQTSFSALDTARDDRADGRAAFLVFERSASFGSAATSVRMRLAKSRADERILRNSPKLAET